MEIKPLLALILALAITPTISTAQGSLEAPGGVPQPTQKSLQELWDKMEAEQYS